MIGNCNIYRILFIQRTVRGTAGRAFHMIYRRETPSSLSLAVRISLSLPQYCEALVEKEGQKFVENLGIGYVGSFQMHPRSLSSRLYDSLDMICCI